MYKFFRTSSIAGRLSLVFTLMNGFALFLTVLGFTLIVVYFSYRSFKQELTAIASLIATSSRAPLAFMDQQAGDRVLSALEANSNIQYGILIDQSGKIFSSFGEPNIELDLKKINFRESNFELLRNGDVFVTQPVVLDSEQVGTVIISGDLSSLLGQLTSIAILSALMLLVIGFVSTLFSNKLKGWVSEPIDSLRQIAHKVSMTKDFSVRLDTSSHDEIADLIRTFNFMIENIEERDKGIIAAKERAEKADRVKSAFLASMSHELRTPLHAIIHITEELLESKVSGEQEEMLLVAKNAGDSLLSIINDILDFSKIEATKMSLNSTEFEIAPFMKRTMNMFHFLATKKKINLVLDMDPQLPQFLKTDPGRLSQILVNLVGNAIKFTDLHGRITVRIRKSSEEGTFTNSRCSLHFSVEDTGIGIPQDKLEYVFEAFSQIQDPSKTRQGTGLGLTITSRLVKLMGGKIWVNSTLGQGSTFHFIIPCTVTGVGSAESAVHYEQRTPKLDDIPVSDNLSDPKRIGPKTDFTVLIVEDNLVNQKLAQRLLQKYGIQSLTALNGEEGLEIYKTKKVDLILMDINMPVMDGIEATKQIRAYEAEKRARRVPVIAVTAGVSQEETNTCLEVGMDDYVLKPFRPKDLIQKINIYCGTEELALQPIP